jgi:hypothetical protein
MSDSNASPKGAGSQSKAIKARVTTTLGYGKEQTVYLNQGKRHGVKQAMFVAVDFSIGNQKGTRTGKIIAVFATRSKAITRRIHSSKCRFGEVRISDEAEEEVLAHAPAPQTPQTTAPEKPAKDLTEPTHEANEEEEEEDPRWDRWFALESEFDKSIDDSDAQYVVDVKALNLVARRMALFANRLEPKKQEDEELATYVERKLKEYADVCGTQSKSNPALKTTRKRLLDAGASLTTRGAEPPCHE